MHQKEITKELRYIITDVDKMLYNTDWERLDKYRNSIEFLIKRIANDESEVEEKWFDGNYKELNKGLPIDIIDEQVEEFEEKEV